MGEVLWWRRSPSKLGVDSIEFRNYLKILAKEVSGEDIARVRGAARDPRVVSKASACRPRRVVLSKSRVFWVR